MLAQMKAVTVKTQNMRQKRAESIRLYVGRLKGAARHCYFNQTADNTFYTDKMILYTLVQGLEDAAIAKDVMEEYSTKKNLQTHLPTGSQELSSCVGDTLHTK